MFIDQTDKSGDSLTCVRDPSKKFPYIQCCFNSTNKNTSDHDQSSVCCSYSRLFHKERRSKNFSQSSLMSDEILHSDPQQLGRREITAEARVTRSLAIVIGCFICCWLPFFTLYIIRAVCLCLSFNAIEFFVWLGYSNSSINPVLYAILNKNFRLAFKNIFLSVKKLVFL